MLGRSSLGVPGTGRPGCSLDGSSVAVPPPAFLTGWGRVARCLCGRQRRAAPSPPRQATVPRAGRSHAGSLGPEMMDPRASLLAGPRRVSSWASRAEQRQALSQPHFSFRKSLDSSLRTPRGPGTRGPRTLTASPGSPTSLLLWGGGGAASGEDEERPRRRTPRWSPAEEAVGRGFAAALWAWNRSCGPVPRLSSQRGPLALARRPARGCRLPWLGARGLGGRL